MMTCYRKKPRGFTEQGFTLTELFVTVAIIGIVAAIAGLQMTTWLGKARVEEETKKLYTDLVSARTRALYRNRMCFVTLDTALNRYQVWEDTDPYPDGDGVLAAADTKVQDITINDQLLLKTPAFTLFNFDSKGLITGLISAPEWIGVKNTFGAVNDCIGVSATRIHIGRYDGTNCSQ